jgi:hypothetical protein
MYTQVMVVLLANNLVVSMHQVTGKLEYILPAK